MPSRLSPEVKRKFDRLLAAGFPTSRAADYAGVSRKWAYSRKKHLLSVGPCPMCGQRKKEVPYV